MPHKSQNMYNLCFMYLNEYLKVKPRTQLLSIDHEPILRTMARKYIEYDSLILCRFHSIHTKRTHNYDLHKAFTLFIFSSHFDINEKII